MIEHDVAYGLERAIELAPNDGCPITLTIGECESLVSRLRQAEKDAARYRWLREQPCSGWEIDGEETSHIDVTMWRNDGFDNCNNGESLFGESMDAAIDEAMQCNGDNK